MKKKDKSPVKKPPRRSGDRGSWAFFIFFFVVFLVITYTSGQVHAAGRTVRVGVYQNEPKIFMDTGGHASGIYIDLLAEIGAEEGWTLVYVPCEWADCLAALENGQIDLMPDVAYSTERAQIYDFNLTPVLESWSQVYASPQREGQWIQRSDWQAGGCTQRLHPTNGIRAIHARLRI